MCIHVGTCRCLTLRGGQKLIASLQHQVELQTRLLESQVEGPSGIRPRAVAVVNQHVFWNHDLLLWGLIDSEPSYVEEAHSRACSVSQQQSVMCRAYFASRKDRSD